MLPLTDSLRRVLLFVVIGALGPACQYVAAADEHAATVPENRRVIIIDIDGLPRGGIEAAMVAYPRHHGIAGNEWFDRNGATCLGERVVNYMSYCAQSCIYNLPFASTCGLSNWQACECREGFANNNLRVKTVYDFAHAPAGVAFNMYCRGASFADTNNFRIRKVKPDGTIHTIAGTDGYVYNGDGPDATAATLGFPQYLAVDAFGNVYVSDGWNNRVRKLVPK